MRTIYPKLITTLFFVLLAAVVIRFADSHGHSSSADRTAIFDKGSNAK